MLVKLEALKQVVHELIVEVDDWFSQKEATTISHKARQRWCYLRKKLREIYGLQQELEELVPNSAMEALQQQPLLWLDVENKAKGMLKADPELDGIQVILQKEGTAEKANSQRAVIWYITELDSLNA